jgi:hypothetical protein
MSTKKQKNLFPKQIVKVDLLLGKVLEEACYDDTTGASLIICACKVLEELKLAEGSEWTSKSGDGTVTDHHMFIATEELRELLTNLGMLDDFI